MTDDEEDAMTATTTRLGTGALTWRKHERVTDRYGAVAFVPPDSGALKVPDALVGATGALVATVVEPRASRHVGDWFHGFGQDGPPPEGARFVLGEGTLFVEVDEWGPVVGVSPDRPDDARFWLDPEALYAVHESVVALTFEVTP